MIATGNNNSVYDQARISFNINQYGMLELVYDGTINRWFILGYRQ